VTFPTAPKTEVTAKGDIVYSEVVRENVRKLEAYVEEMARATQSLDWSTSRRSKMTSSSFAQSSSPSQGFPKSKKNRIKALYEGVVRSLRKDLEPTRARAATRSRRSSSQFPRELDLDGQFNEYQDQKAMGSTVLALSVGEVPEGRQRSPYLVSHTYCCL
jgi:fatty acid synthase subunit alpha, fungi type